MQRKGNIKWRKIDYETVRKEVNRFNAKINRTIKNHPELADIQPKKIKVSEFIENIKTRSDFNRELKSLKRYSARGAEKPITSKTGNVVTAWERKEYALKVGVINRKRSLEMKRQSNTPVTSQGKDTGLKRGEMGESRLVELKPKKFDFDKIEKGKAWDMFKKSVDKMVMDNYEAEKMDRYKENYIKALKTVFGNFDINELIKQIEEIPSSKVVDTFYSEQESSIDFIYDPIELETRLDILTEIWGNVYEELHE